MGKSLNSLKGFQLWKWEWQRAACRHHCLSFFSLEIDFSPTQHHGHRFPCYRLTHYEMIFTAYITRFYAETLHILISNHGKICAESNVCTLSLLSLHESCLTPPSLTFLLSTFVLVNCFRMTCSYISVSTHVPWELEPSSIWLSIIVS